VADQCRVEFSDLVTFGVRADGLQDDHADWHVQDVRSGVKNTWVSNTEAHPFRVAGALVWYIMHHVLW
jgi:hypothetical protein